MYGSYDRTRGVALREFTSMKATGKPSAAEAALLEPFRVSCLRRCLVNSYRAAGHGRIGTRQAASGAMRHNCLQRSAGFKLVNRAGSCPMAGRSRSNF